jgi:hypothetical protein
LESASCKGGFAFSDRNGIEKTLAGIWATRLVNLLRILVTPAQIAITLRSVPMQDVVYFVEVR